MRTAIFGLSLLVVCACDSQASKASDGGPTMNRQSDASAAAAPPYDMFPAAYLAAICSSIRACPDAALTGFDCEGTFGPLYRDLLQPSVDSVKQGTATYDATTAARCLDVAGHLSCTTIEAADMGNAAPESQELSAAGCSSIFQATQ